MKSRSLPLCFAIATQNLVMRGEPEPCAKNGDRNARAIIITTMKVILVASDWVTDEQAPRI